MRRKAVLISALSILPLSSYDEHAVSIIKFDRPYDKYVRAYFGCPETGVFDAPDCKPHLGKRDYDAWKEARKRAMDLFDLREK